MRKLVLAGCLLCAAVLAGCPSEPRPKPAIAATRPAATEVETVFGVSTAEEFIQAVGSDRTIELDPGEYDLTSLIPRYLRYVFWTSEDEDRTLCLLNVRNLKIRGRGEKRVRILHKSASANVLNFYEVENLELENLEIGHWPDPGYCNASVLFFQQARNVTIRNCDLFGCGAVGLNAIRVEGLRMERSVIRDCSEGILTAEGSRNLRFLDCLFTKNKGGFSLSDSRGIRFDDCRMEGNTTGTLFQVDGENGVFLRGCSIRKNRFETLCDVEKSVSLQDTAVEENEKPPKEGQ